MKGFLLPFITIIGLALSCQKAPEEVPVASITIGQATAEMIIGETVQLTATVTPSNATDKSVTWASSKQSVATVTKTGLVTAIAEGTSTVTASSGGKSALCIVTVSKRFVPVTSVELNKSSIELVEGDSETLIATVKPDDATDKTVTWSTSDKTIATVENGKVTAVKAGEATITANAGEKSATCKITVAKKIIPVTSVELNLTTLELIEEESETLVATVKPDDATDKTVTWSTSDASIAMVDNGVVAAIKVGSATITARAGDKEATCAVTVKSKVTTDPFTITSAGSTTVSITKQGYPYDIILEYRKGEGDWSEYIIGSPISLVDGELVQFIAGEGGNANFSKGSDYHTDYYKFVVSGSGKVKVSGNIMSLLDKTGKRTTMPEYGFFMLFYGCTNLTDASQLKLPSTTLANSCYSWMFGGCDKLQKTPELPATTLAKYCYSSMFDCCRCLEIAPELPATILADGCYSSMFSYCDCLQTAPELPATTLAKYCYENMFYCCSSLQTPPELPATTLADGCYDEMFRYCSSLETAPELPATTLAQSCYQGMFVHCRNLTTAPKLPATTLADSCYGNMFDSCEKLQIAPELPATTLANHCYDHMFASCKKLQKAPELPATTLADSCYYLMFYSCSSLQTAPELPATTLVDSCYHAMFADCKKLNYVKALFTTTPSSIYTGHWLDNVSSTGTFVKSKDATWDVKGTSGIPSGWTVVTE